MSCHQFEPQGTARETLTAHLPTGMAWDAFRTPGKVAYRLLTAFAKSFDDMSAALCRMILELNPYSTEQMLPEWERSVSLPDPCLPKAVTLDERRFWVVWRLTKRRWTTAQDWQDLASLFGLEIAITPGSYVQRPALYAYRYPKRYDLFPKLGRFRVYIDILNVDFKGYPYGGATPKSGQGYPVPYGVTPPGVTAFMCLIDRVRPANVVVIWNEFPTTDERVCTRRTFSDEFAEPFC